MCGLSIKHPFKTGSFKKARRARQKSQNLKLNLKVLKSPQVLEYVKSMFDFAGLPIPTTWMSAKGLKERSQALRGR